MFITKRLQLFLWILLWPFGVTFPADVNCEVLKYATYCTATLDKLTTIDSVVIQINNRTGERYSKVSLDYSSINPISNLQAWIEDAQGNVVRTLKKQDFTDVSAVSEGSFYSDYFTRQFVLKHTVYPYRICYTYTKVVKQFMYIANWDPILDTDVPTRHAKLVFAHPVNYRAQIFENRIGPSVNKMQSELLTRVWQVSYDGSFKNEVCSPEPAQFLPYVRIVPIHFLYGVPGMADTWQSFGNWQYRLIKGLEELPDSEKKVVTELISKAKDKKDIVRILYHYLQDHTHYILVSINIGGMKPYPAAYVAQNRYGDCKALTIYMKALLKYAGIESYYTLVRRSLSLRAIPTEMPSQQFNHVVLTVPVDNDTIWLENTGSFNPFGYAGTDIQNRHALLVDENHSRLIRTPALKEQDVREIRRMDYKVYTDGHAELSARFVYRGAAFELFSQLIDQYTNDFQNYYIHKYLSFPVFELQDWKIVKEGRDARNLTLNTKMLLQNVSGVIGKESYFSFYPLSLPDFEQPKNRKLPVQLPYPVCVSDTLTYQLPDGVTQISVPDDADINSKYGSYQISFEQHEGQVFILRNFLLARGDIPLAEYADFYAFLAAIKTEEKRKILFQ